jgi:hypothetical protein
VVTALANDPLVYYGRAPAVLHAEILRAMQPIELEAERIILPFIALQGGANRIVNSQGHNCCTIERQAKTRPSRSIQVSTTGFSTTLSTSVLSAM